VLVLALSGLYIGGYALLQRLGGLIPAASFAALGIDPAARAHAGFGNPVFLGAWLVLVTPVLIAEALTGPSRTRWLAGLAAGLCLPALLATESAGSWFGFGIAAVLGLWLLLPTRLRVLMGIILALAAASLAIGGFDTLARERVHTLIWRDSWELFSAHPGGVGPGQFQVAFLPYASPELLEIHPRSAVIINDAHSEPLQLLVELGWPALLAVLVAVLCGFQAARQRLAEPFEDRHQRALFVAALAAVGGSVGQSFVSPDLRFHVTVLMLGVLIGFLASQSQALVAPLGWGKPGRALVALLALAGLTFTGLQTWDRIQFAEKIRPPAPADTSPDTIQRIDTLQAAVEAAPDDPLRLYELGSALFEARRHAEAAEAFRNALALDPHNPIIARSLGITQSLSGQYDQAVVHLRMSLKAKPDDPDIRYLVAFSAFGRGDLLTALTEVEELLADYPDHERAAVLLERLRE
jgi:cytochrome c-type biogenesis protein CcmH/NrfG